MKLVIDTKNSKEIKVAIVDGEKRFEEISTSSISRPESVLNLVERLCIKNKIALKEIKSIELEKGPGSYTGLKVGASIANALSFSLSIPVNGNPIGHIEEPIY